MVKGDLVAGVHVHADRDVCIGAGMCVLTAGAVFDQDDDGIVVLLDDCSASFSAIIKYRTDNATSWTTAATQTNTKRAVADTIGAEFYTLQVRIDLDDDTGLNKDFRIDSVSVLYTEADA